jgi:hypothetical protein
MKASMDEFYNATEAVQLGRELNEEEAGRRLFYLVAACREGSIDPEAALRRYASKITREVEKSVGEGTGKVN